MHELLVHHSHLRCPGSVAGDNAAPEDQGNAHSFKEPRPHKIDVGLKLVVLPTRLRRIPLDADTVDCQPTRD